MSKRPRDEFFEVFRRSPEETKQHTLWAGISSGPGDRSGRRRVLTLSYGALALCAAVAVALAIMAYALGYFRGKAHRGMSAPVGVPAALDSERPVGSRSPATAGGTDGDPDAPLAPPPPGEPFYALRVMSAVPLANAMLLRDDLRAMGYQDVFVYDGRGSTGYTVNIGRFSALQERAASGLKEKVRKEIYKGKRLFEDCYLTRISDLGRIVE